MTITGTAGDDNLVGTSIADTFDLSQGGNDTASGGNGADIFLFAGTFTAADRIDGGSGTDTIRLNGDYSAGVILGATTLLNVEAIQLFAGHDYALTTDDGNVAAGRTLTIDASLLAAGDHFTFNGLDETDGSFVITGGAGDDVMRGGMLADTIDASAGGYDRIYGMEGDDTVVLGTDFSLHGKADGGAGHDTAVLNGDFTYSHALVLTPTTLRNFEVLRLSAGHSYDLTLDAATVGILHGFTVDGSALLAGDSLVIDGSAVSRGLNIRGGAGNDDITGGTGIDNNIDLSQGGNDIAQAGGEGSTLFIMGAAMTAADSLIGGDGSDVILLDGDYSGVHALVMRASTMRGIDELEFNPNPPGAPYDITLNRVSVAGGRALIVAANGATLNFNGAAVTGGHLIFSQLGAGSVVTGGALADTFNQFGNAAVMHGGGGDDLFTASVVNAGDVFDGGAGTDTLTLSGPGSATLLPGSLLAMENIVVANGHWDIVSDDSNVAAGAILNVTMGSGGSSDFDGAAETNGRFAFVGGTGDDSFTGGAKSDTFDLSSGGSDRVTGGGSSDSFISGTNTIFVYGNVMESTGAHYDIISQLNFATGDIEMNAIGKIVQGIDSAVAGTLSTASFNSNLASAATAGALLTNHALLFTANAGTLNGHTFLVVDVNGTAGYQANADLVIEVTGYSGTLTTADFS